MQPPQGRGQLGHLPGDVSLAFGKPPVVECPPGVSLGADFFDRLARLFHFDKPPSVRQLVLLDQAFRGEIKTKRTHPVFWFPSEVFLFVAQEVDSGSLAFDEYRDVPAPESDSVWDFSATDGSQFAKNESAARGFHKPGACFPDELIVC